MKNILFTILLISSVFALPKLGDKAPTFFTKKLDGGSFFLSDSLERNNRPIVLSFFATWCVPCRVEIPKLDSLKNVYTDIDFYLINVSGLKQGTRTLKEDPVMVRKMIAGLKTKITVLLDKYGVAAEKYGATALPTTSVIDKNGNIVYLHTGYKLGDEIELASILKNINKSAVEK